MLKRAVNALDGCFRWQFSLLIKTRKTQGLLMTTIFIICIYYSFIYSFIVCRVHRLTLDHIIHYGTPPTIAHMLVKADQVL